MSPHQRLRTLLATALLVPALLLPAAPVVAGAGAPAVHATVDPALRQASGAVGVIVQAHPGSVEAVAAAVERLGGTVLARLAIVDGLSARVPADAIDALASTPGVVGLTANTTGTFAGVKDAATSASRFVTSTGVDGLWSQNKIGSGVGVAVIDTGISPMSDLANHVVWGPDLSGEGTLVDNYGHGTVMAGLIAGSGNASSTSAGGGYSGMAPGATLYSVKVAGRNGSVDVSTILQAMHWVAAYAAPYNIRVLNLSWGTPSTQDPAHDPLNYAVQRLWRQGVVVVVSAGNSGPTGGTVQKPGDDPLAITVGAYDDAVTGSENVPDWSSRGPTAAGVSKPDLVAPGRTLIATRSFGSQVEADNPDALVAPQYIKGSGTSEAAAVTSGAVAALLSARPELTPDQVKNVLARSAVPIKGVAASAQGSGRLAVDRALKAPAGPQTIQTATADGLGSIEGSRGGVHVETDCGDDGTTDVIEGEIDVMCEAWNGTAWTGTAWTGGTWNGTAWYGTAWTGTAWTGTAWSGTAWHGTAWHGTAWHGTAWHGTAWHSAITDEGDAFGTVFWGDKPPAGSFVPGEDNASLFG